MTFAATANAITYTGATPVFVDSDDTGNVDPDLLDEALEDQQRRGAHVAAIVPVDLIGKVADYPAISAVAARHGVPVLVDAAESLGASRDGRPAGADGGAAIVSFNGNKIMTTSGGGALLCDDPDFAARTRYLAAPGAAAGGALRAPGHRLQLPHVQPVGCSRGGSSFERLPGMLERRRAWRRRYAEVFEGVAGVRVFGGDDGRDASAGDDHDNFWLTSIVVDPMAAGWTAEDLRTHLALDDIEARPLWKPMHLQPVFAGSPSYVNGTSERLFQTGLSLPSGSALRDDQFDRVVSHIHTFLEGEALVTAPPTPLSPDGVEGRTITITGGTGSFGSIMAQHLLRDGAARINIFSRDEAKQDQMRRTFNDERVRFFLGDVRDPDSVRTAVLDADFVFHAGCAQAGPVLRVLSPAGGQDQRGRQSQRHRGQCRRRRTVGRAAEH